MNLDTGNTIRAIFDKIESMSEKIGDLYITLARMDEKLDGLHQDRERVEKETKELEQHVEDVEKALEHRIARLEKILWSVVALTPALGGGAAKLLQMLGG